MSLRGAIIAGLATAAFAAASGVAAAEQGGAQLILAANEFAAPSYGGTSTVPKRTLEWDANKGRWGLNLGVEQHSIDSDVQWKDVSPGVYYRLTRRLHIGGAVSLAPDQTQNVRLGQPQLPSPRVRLETTFKF
jgi:hypothetical protein